MTAAEMEALYPAAWIMGNGDGRFEPLSGFEPGAVRAEITLIREVVFDLIEEAAEVVDAVAWEAERSGAWWTLNGTPYIGEWELRASWWKERPARMVSTPAAFIERHGAAFCILNWSADVDDILGPAPGVECDSEALARRLRQTMYLQAAPRRRILESAIRRYPISVTSDLTHASTARAA